MKDLVNISSLSFSYGENKVLEKVNLQIKEKDFVAIIGPNGSGKTTLIKLMLDFLSPEEGEIALSVSRDRIGYVPQYHTIDENFPGTVEEILSGRNGKIISQLDIESLLKKKFVSLSGGQQQKILIALALQRDPKLLILDEPTAGVDIKSQESFYDLLKELNKAGITIIIVTHEVGMIHSFVEKVICLNKRVCCEGKPNEIPKLMKQMYGSDFVPHHHKGVHHD